MHQTANSILKKLMLGASECGKAIRSRTDISRGAVSVASATVQVFRRIFGTTGERRALLVGAGETAWLAAKHLETEGINSWKVSNRTEANAKVVADLLGGRVCSYPPTADDIAWADVIVSATSSESPVITLDLFKSSMKKRRGVQLLLDLAVPRDIDANIKKVSDTYVYSVDDFNELVASNLAAREKEAVRAQKLIDKYVEEFGEWYQENRVSPTIKQLKDVLEKLRVEEVHENARRFHESEQEQLEKFSKSLMRKVTSLIIGNLKRASLEEDDLSLARAVTLALASKDVEDVDNVLERLNHELSH